MITSIDRLAIQVHKGSLEAIRAAADKAGESINAYILEAINRRMISEGLEGLPTKPEIAESAPEGANTPRMESIKATAKIFDVPEHFVRQKVLAGEVIAVKAGCKYLVNVDRFADYLNGNKISASVEQEESAGYTTIHPIPVNL